MDRSRVVILPDELFLFSNSNKINIIKGISTTRVFFSTSMWHFSFEQFTQNMHICFFCRRMFPFFVDKLKKFWSDYFKYDIQAACSKNVYFYLSCYSPFEYQRNKITLWILANRDCSCMLKKISSYKQNSHSSCTCKITAGGCFVSSATYICNNALVQDLVSRCIFSFLFKIVHGGWEMAVEWIATHMTTKFVCSVKDGPKFRWAKNTFGHWKFV